MLTNRDVIGIDQDSLGIQGTIVQRRGATEVWAKPLTAGAVAVALLNRGSSTVQITASPRAIRVASAARYRIENLWTHSAVTNAGAIRASLAAHAAALYRVTAL
jgi:alpha-galactosidase